LTSSPRGEANVQVGSVIVLALVIVVALQSLRTLFPLLFAFGEDVDYYMAAGIGVAAFAAPVLAWPIDRLIGARFAAPIAISALVVVRLLLQFLHPIPLWLAIAGTAMGLIALTLIHAALGRSRASRRMIVAMIVLGLALDTAIRGSFMTWDLPWQEGTTAVVVTVVLSIATLGAAWTLPRRTDTVVGGTGPGVWETAALGVFLMLQLLFLQSPAFVASSTGYSLEGGLTVVLLGDSAALAASWWVSGRSVPPSLGFAAAVILAAIAYAFTEIVGPVIAPLVVLGQVLATGLLTLAVAQPAAARPPATWRVAVGGAVGGVALAILLAGYQIHYEIPLPFSNALLPPAAGLLLGLMAFGRSRPPAPKPLANVAPLAALPLLLLVVPLGLLLSGPDRTVVRSAPPSLRIVNYNIHQGLNPDGQVDPEATARTIEALEPDVLVLQEIGRGWPIHIFMDTGEWLSRRLEMPFLYQRAADPQFGNAMMTRLPILEHDAGFLPFGAGPQQRSYLRARIDLGGGSNITLIDVHLQHQEDKPATREAQIERLLDVWGGEKQTVIAGDMNTQPDEPNLDLFLDAGLLSVQDEAGLGYLPTATEEVVGGDRVDYVFVTPDVSISRVAVPYSFASDHLPIAVTVSTAESTSPGPGRA
jgi:endonuclease/exonuclease/phosphatase family metal-dependent hydrolase